MVESYSDKVRWAEIPRDSGDKVVESSKTMTLFRFFVGVSFFITLFFSSNALKPKCSCDNHVCKAVIKLSSDFQTSKQLCETMRGQLMTVKSKTVSDDVGDLLMDMPGDYWIGLRLPDGHSTNNTLPLKGYIWTTGLQSTEFTNWKSNEVWGSSLCVSMSVDLKWTEKSCLKQSDGFLCENVPEHECSNFEDPGYSKVVYDPVGCLSGICEHNCNIVDDKHFRCSCSTGYVISKKEPYICELDCSTRCHAECDRHGGSCECPDGYILDEMEGEHYCEDINECELSYCDQYCFNSLGSYECSCRDGFRLADKGKCVQMKYAAGTEGTTDSVFHGPSSDAISSVAAVAPGKVIGVMAVILVGIGAVVLFVRYWKQKKQKPSINSTCKEDDAKQVIVEEPCQELC